MAKNNAPKKSSPRKLKPAAAAPPPPMLPTWQHRLGQEMTALLLLGLAGFCFLALGSYALSDPQGFLATLNAMGAAQRRGQGRGAGGGLFDLGPGSGRVLGAAGAPGSGLAGAPPRAWRT